MPRGRTCSRGSSPCALPVLRPVAIKGSTRRCLADAGRGDWVLCQITSSRMEMLVAIPLDAPESASGGLLVASFARPGKLFTAHAGLMIRSVGILTQTALTRVLSQVVAILQPPPKP